jgi:hypothetical protein
MKVEDKRQKNVVTAYQEAEFTQIRAGVKRTSLTT